MSELSDELRAWVGRTASYTAPEPLGRAAIRYYATAVGDRNPLYLDDSAARAAGIDGVMAPPTLVCDTCQYVDADPDADGYAGHTWGFEALGTALRGGNSYEFHQPVRPNDVITATWKLTQVDERIGSDGSGLFIVSSEVTYTNQHGDVLATNLETIILSADKR